MEKKETKVRTTGELSVLLKAVGALLGAMSVTSAVLVKRPLAVLLILIIPVGYLIAAMLIARSSRSAMMMNTIDSSGIKNSYLGETVCLMSWDEIGDFGVAETSHGLFRGRYIYLSRIFVGQEVRRDIIKKYDHRVCIVLPCTDEICDSVREASRGKIDIR